MKYEWDVLADGTQHRVALEEGWLWVDENAALPLRKYQKRTHLREQEFLIPVGDKKASLHILSQKDSAPVLSFEGRNCATGGEYRVAMPPGWAWTFAVLYILNWLLIVGGAIGGAIWSVCAWFTMRIAADGQTSTVKRVLISIGIYVITTIVTLIAIVKIIAILY